MKKNQVIGGTAAMAGIFRFVLLLGFTCILTSCAAEKRCRYDVPSLFPPPPEELRIQYLTGINSEEDIGLVDKKKQSSFSLIVTGKEAPDVIKKLGKSYGITAYKGKVYVVEGINARVVIIDLAKGTFEYLKGLETPRGKLKYPVNLAFDDDGNLYVADTGRKEIVVYDPAGNFKTSFGNYDPKSKIVSVLVHKGNLYALDLGNSLIRVLDRKTGEQTTTFGYSEKPNQSIRAPVNFTTDAAGNLYVTNVGNNRVIKLDIDGNFLGMFGGHGDNIGAFAKPKGIAVDDAGRIYVVDGGTNVVQIFDDQFRPLMFFGWPGLESGSLNGPAGIFITKENVEYFQKYAVPGFKVEYLIYVVNQFGQEFCIPRISVYGFGQQTTPKANPLEGATEKKPEPAKPGGQ